MTAMRTPTRCFGFVEKIRGRTLMIEWIGAD
jgi:hypothetical protein